MPSRTGVAARLGSRWRERVRRWIRGRQGEDANPVVLASRRLYILPTGLGAGFAGMLFLMLVGAMNYANNLALGLAFLLGALGLVTMHHCHRNLARVRVSGLAVAPVFAGQTARFAVALENDASQPRPELQLACDVAVTSPVSLGPAGQETARAVLELAIPAERRGRLCLDRFEVFTRHPFGLFRVWAVVHMPLECIVYPKLGERNLSPPPRETDVGGAQDGSRGEEEFAGLRPLHPGDSPRRIAWKAYARGQGLHVKQFAGTAVTSHLFTWSSLEGLGTEARLSQLARWITDAHAAGRAYGLVLPGTRIDVNVGASHRQRCLTALALYEDA